MATGFVRDLLPSTGRVLIGAGAVLAIIGVVVVQIAARVWLQHNRAERLREHVARVEARWHEAAM